MSERELSDALAQALGFEGIEDSGWWWRGELRRYPRAPLIYQHPQIFSEVMERLVDAGERLRFGTAHDAEGDQTGVLCTTRSLGTHEGVNIFEAAARAFVALDRKGKS